MGWSQDPAAQRAMLALSFEPSGDGHVYYHRRWSRGIPGSAEEREDYLRIPALGSRRAWRNSIAGRPTVPPRAHGPVQRKIFETMPWHIGPLMLLVGMATLIQGLNATGLLGRANLLFGIFCLFGALRFFRARSGGKRSPPK